MRLPFTFSCPACRAAGQRFPIYQAIERKTCTRCSSCGSKVAMAPLGLIFVASILTADRAGRSDLDAGDVSPLAKRHAL